jgi:two-component system cell cycle response regulator
MPRVLTVDDSRAIRMIVTKVLTEMNLEVDEAEDGEKGLLRLEELEFDLVILDVTMPVLDGPGMLAKMREAGNKTPVLMLTSESKRSIVAEIMKLKIEDYILKPFKNDELKAKIFKILKARDPNIMDALSSAQTVQQSAGTRKTEMSINNDSPAPGRQFADILVIDDMDNVAKKLRGMLPAHITQMSGLTGQAGLKLARDNTYRVILIDRELPDVPATTLIKQLRVLQPNAACLAMTLRSSNNIVKECKDEGFDDVLFKPFGQDALDDMLQAFFQTTEMLGRQENVLTAAAFNGRPERVDRYYQRISVLVKDAVKDIAEACFENVILDANKMPADPSRMAQLITEFDTTAKGFGLSVTLVGPPAIKRVLENFADTKDVRVVETLKEARE